MVINTSLVKYGKFNMNECYEVLCTNIVKVSFTVFFVPNPRHIPRLSSILVFVYFQLYLQILRQQPMSSWPVLLFSSACASELLRWLN